MDPRFNNGLFRASGNMSSNKTEADNLLLTLNNEVVDRNLPLISVLGLLMLIGVLENLVVMVTYRRRIRAKSTYFFIFCLAALDLLNCLVLIPFALFNLSHPYTYTWEAVCQAQSFLTFSADLASGYTTVCVAFDRYRRVTRPGYNLSRARSRAAVVSVLIFSFTLCSVTLLISGRKRQFLQDAPGVELYKCGLVESSAVDLLPVIFLGTLGVGFLVGGIVIVVLYVKLTLGIRHKLWKERPASMSLGSMISLDSRKPSTDTSSRRSSLDAAYGEADRPNEIANKPVFTLISNCDLGKIYSAVKHQSIMLQTIPAWDPRGIRTCKRSEARVSAARDNQLRPTTTYDWSNRVTCSCGTILNRTSVMLCLATLVYLCSHFPYICLKLTSFVFPSVYRDLQQHSSPFWNSLEYSYVIGFIANPVIYSFLNRRFRQQCVAFCGTHRRRMSYSTSVTFRRQRFSRDKCRSTSNTARNSNSVILKY